MPLTSKHDSRNYNDPTKLASQDQQAPLLGVDMNSQGGGHHRPRHESKHMAKRWRTQYAAVVGTVASTAVAVRIAHKV
jgi:hypothetical protein